MSQVERKPISTESEWTFELIDEYDREIRRVAQIYKLDTYPNQIEIISAEQMLDAYSSVGMPEGFKPSGFGLPAGLPPIRNRPFFRPK